MQKIYAFSGLGADKRAFSKLDFSGFEVVYIDWIEPRTSEGFESYVYRLAEHYQVPKQGAYVIGVSFGGICIAELAKFYDFKKIVLISSAKTKSELPKLYKLSKLIPFHKWIPEKQGNRVTFIHYWLFGAQTMEEKEILAEIIQDTDVHFLKWAMDKIVHWENTTGPKNCLHIHGNADRIIPIRNVDYSIKIERGGHLMVWNKAAEISFHILNYFL